ncbi:hypothetical protein O3M35_005899 [Rhynocoris fuscipes]|uniref:Glutaredoxin domain-containing protein n=1 Tax=Rhynocoris fuscipes TaxID=488301 RepID=A0AAW1DMP2_9HEMI
MAKSIFNKLRKRFTVIELDKRNDGDQIQRILGEITGVKSVPRVFVNGICLGGGSDVQSLYENGQLQRILDN